MAAAIQFEHPAICQRIAAGEVPIVIMGIRPGVKLHELMISSDDVPCTYEYDQHFKILPAIHHWHICPERIQDGRRVPEGFSYTSDNNSDWMTPQTLLDWVSTHRDRIGKI